MSAAAAERKPSIVQHITAKLAGLADPPTDRDIPLPPSPEVWNHAPRTRADGKVDLNLLRDRVESACRQRDRARQQAEQAMEVFAQYKDLARIAMDEFDAAVVEIRKANPDVEDVD